MDEHEIGEAEAGAVLTVDLAAVAENYRRLRARAAPAECAAVLKADAYGLGAERVGHALMRRGCRTFFVAHVGEGVALRSALGSDPAIYVLHGAPAGAEATCAAAALRPAINSREQLDAWREMSRRAGRPLAAAIQADTGMSRIGFASKELDALLSSGAFADLRIELVLSHLACADEPAHPANAAQLAAFEASLRRLPAVPAALANSSGIFLGEAYRFDMVRAGAALFGVNPTPGRPNPMAPVVTLRAKVVQTRTIPAGAGVGYGHDFRSTETMRLATLSIGYADGWPRNAVMSAWRDGVQLPLVGRISMDSVVADVSLLPPGAVNTGDLVEMIGRHQGIDDVARAAGTIGYDILTRLGRRFHRRFVDG